MIGRVLAVLVLMALASVLVVALASADALVSELQRRRLLRLGVWALAGWGCASFALAMWVLAR